MLIDQLCELAIRQLADFDARTPNRMFSEPVELSIPQAYEIQGEVARLRERREKIIGYKVGCTSAAIQRQLGISEPIFARIFETGCHAAGVRLSCGDYANPAVEVNSQCALGADLTGSPRSDEYYREAIQHIFPVIELHHYVLHSARPSSQELIASNGMHAGFVLAENERGAAPSAIPGLTIQIKSASGGVIAESSTKSRPVESLRWLAGCLAEQGLQLWKGQIVLTGSPMPLFPAAPGSHVVVTAESTAESRAEFVV